MEKQNAEATADFWWKATLIGAPIFFIFLGLKEKLMNRAPSQVAILIVSFGIGLLVIGFFASRYIIGKSKNTKITVAIVFFLIMLCGAFLFRPHVIKAGLKSRNEKYTTCPVCGYIAYDSNNESCDVCASALTQESLSTSGYKNYDVYTYEEQLYYFFPDKGEDINFYEPEIVDGFEKDKNWQPVVPKDTLLKYAGDYYSYSKLHSILTDSTQLK